MSGIEFVKDSYKGKRCFIVATGPSLAYKDLSFLKNEITIALNLAPITLDIQGIRPTFNIIADKFQYPSFKEVFKELTYKKNVKKIIVASACETFPEELKDEETYFFPKKLKQEKANFSENPIVNGFARGKTVAFDAIQLAYYLGFDEVYILGMDMDTNKNWGENGHCYEIQKNARFKGMEFFKNNSMQIQRGLPGHPKYRELIESCMALAKNHFEKAGRKIFNDSRSTINVFEKKDILKEFGNLKKIVAFVPAKGTSTRLKAKNLKELGGKALFLHILDTLSNCYMVDEVYLDSESNEIFNIAKGRTHKIMLRDPSLASNKTDGNQLLLNEASKVDADIYVQALPTAPFLTSETIDNAIFKLLTSQNNDSLFAVIKDKRYLWKDNGSAINYDPIKIPNSIDLDSTITETMGLYIIRRETLIERKSRIGNKPILFEIPQIEAIDINTPEDFNFAEIVYRGMEVFKNEKIKE
jgi:CMP-N-acetylneuraminic acid synthetase